MCKCKMCGEEYSKADLRELRMMGDDYNRFPFICPDCWDNFQRLDLEDQEALLMNDFEESLVIKLCSSI